MNKTLLALIAFTSLVIIGANKVKPQKMKVQINITGKLDSNEIRGQIGSFYSINIDLLNNKTGTKIKT